MTDASVSTQARESRGRWPGLVWIVPIAALLLVGFLGLRALAHRGVNVVVTFTNSAGARVGDTKVIFQGVEAGHVTKIEINKDNKRVDMSLRLDYRAKPFLRTGTEFWLVGAMPSLTDVSSLKAALAGVTVGVAPGPGAPARHFIGLERPPAVAPGTPGRAFTLTAEKIGSVRANSSVFYRGAEAGKVTSVDLVGLQGFTVDVFLNAPYDHLIRRDTLFWIASPLQVSVTGEGVQAQIAPGNSALTGGVELTTPKNAETEPESAAGSRFVLYSGRGEAIASGHGPQVAYDLAFNGPIGDLEEGAAVKLAGRQVGAVRDVGFTLSANGRELRQPVTIVIRPERLNLQSLTPPANGDWRAATNAALAGLVARGYRAKLVQSPPLLGAHSISLEYVKNAPPARLTPGIENTMLPTAISTDVAGLTDQASAILDKVNAIPIERIGVNVQQLTARLNTLVGSPRVSDSLAHLDNTLRQVDDMMREVKPKVGPLIAKLDAAASELDKTASAATAVLSGEGQAQDSSLPEAIRQLTEASRTLRSLGDYLGRHPEALLRGKAKERR